LGPYEILAPVGAGGMGEVYQARDTRLDRVVAIKLSKEQFSARFEREARAAAQLNHPNICTLYDVGPNYLVMELIEGETLAARLEAGEVPTGQIVKLGSEIADALAAAHAKGIVHRDLKPGNIMLSKTGSKVLDFGLAKSPGEETLTLTNAVIGTPAYMAPEQRAGKACDARTDIYALGLVLAEMATGQRTPIGERPQLDSLPEGLAHVVERCLAPDPDQRWQTARDVKSELEWAGRQAPGPARAQGPVRAVRLWQGIAVTAMAVLAALVFVHFRGSPTETPVVYTSILAPEKTSFDFKTNLGPVALSPDGKHMAFAATGEDGQSQLWIRSLDSDRAQPLPGTSNGRFPFWSPDSRWVAFFADRMLKKIDTHGGQPVRLAEASGASGGSWSAKGVIVFAPGMFAPLLKVSSEGGSTSKAVEEDVAMGTAHGFPWFLPDGEHFLFVSWGGAGHMNLRVGSLSSTASQMIGETDSNVVYSQGHLLYLRDHSLLAQHFDSTSLRATREAVPIAGRVERFMELISVGAFSVSATGLLAYQTGEGAGLRQLTWLDSAGKAVGTIGEPLAFFDIEFSPDRKKLAASAPDMIGNYDIWLYDTARGLPTRFTSDPAGEYWSAWSKDGKSVIFNSTRKGHYDLYRKSADGSGPEELLYADDNDKVPVSWSPDGKHLLYFTGGGARFDLWLLPLTPERPGVPLKAVSFHQTRFNELSPRFSPDGQWVTYSSDESGRYEVYVSPFSRIAEKHRVSADVGVWPRWRQDGKAIFYIGKDDQLMTAEVRTSGETVEVGAARAVFGKAVSVGGCPYDISADGQRVLAALPAERRKTAEPITLVENWTAALKK
jgi:Tol biopolymer transport system component